MRFRFPFLALLLLAVPLGSWAGDSYAFRLESGSFNRAYQDREWITSTKTSFGVPYGALGSEFVHKDEEGNLWALGLAQTTVGSGRRYNWDRWEVQPLTLFNFAGLSVGKDYRWIEWGLGVGAIVQVKDFDAVSYWKSDGVPGPGKASGLDWNRHESFTVMTGLLRLLSERGPHVVVRVARGPLSLTENLMHVQGVWPLGDSRLDAELGFSSPMGLFFHGDGVLRSNERLTVGWLWGGPEARIGLRAGLLMRTLIEGSGGVDLFRRLSVGVEWAVSP